MSDIPDINQVREALERDEHQRELDPTSRRTFAAVARAFVDGNLIPGEVDYEAGARARYEFHRRWLIAAWEKQDKMMLLPEWVELDDAEREGRINEVRLVVDAALSAFQESGEK